MTLKAKLNTEIVGDEPPSEFRIFRYGVNKSSKGDFVFSKDSAAKIMGAFTRAGNDGMIDLEHLSIDSEAKNYDPDARGAYRLEVRNDGLWAVNVKWNEDGAERLRAKKQRYFSPYFGYNEKSGEIVELYNIAICAIPATYDAPALVAASKRVGKTKTLSNEEKKMDWKKILAALGLGEDATLDDALAAIKALQESGEETQSDEDPKEEKQSDKEEEKMSDDEKALSALPGKLQARVMAALSGHDSLKKEIEEIKGKNAKSEVEALIAANTDKIPLSMEKWARKQSPEVLQEYLSHAVASPRQKEQPKREETTTVALSDVEISVARRAGMDPAVVLEHKKKRAAQAAATQQ